MNFSVCMAAYNGEKYIKKQIQSILNQLGENDELIIVDDDSQDNTVEIIKSFKDTRIQLYCNNKNIGFLKSFEKSIILAQKEIICLCDQDDIWMKEKLKCINDIFVKNNIDLLFHDAVIINEYKDVIYSSFKDIRKIYLNPIMNFIKNSFTGCCMAFRKSVVNIFLPIPPGVIYHDRWIVILCGIFKMKIFFLDKPLIYYVRHSNNVSPLHKGNIYNIIIDRIRLFGLILGFVFLKWLKYTILK